MKAFTLSTRNFIAVGVPADARDFIKDMQTMISYKLGDGRCWTEKMNCDFKIINSLSQLTEGDCKGLVENFNWGVIVGYKNYNAEEPMLDTAKESLISKLKSEGILAKSIVEEPKYDVSKGDGSAYKFLDWQKLPDDLLIIEIP